MGQIVGRFDDGYEGTSITDVHQRDRLGLWHSVVQARPHVDGTFLLVNGDNVFAGSVVPAVAAVGEADAVLGVEEVSPEVATTTSMIEPDERGCVMEIVEKPAEPPSTLVTTGCYVLPEDVFHACALLRPSAEGEYQLSAAVGLLVRAGYEVATVRLGERVNVNTSEDTERASELVNRQSRRNRQGKSGDHSDYVLLLQRIMSSQKSLKWEYKFAK
jgi:glucose-1-phosphate thymidylyltransferase